MKNAIRRRLGMLVLSVVLAQQLSSSVVCHAQGLSVKDRIVSAVDKVTNNYNEEEDPMCGGRRSVEREDNITTFSYGTTSTANGFTNQTYIHNSRFDGKDIHNGIDVSKWQEDINWAAVKNAGIEFAFVRVAARGKADGEIMMDPKASANLKGAAKAGLKVGAYVYSQAITAPEAVEEANYVLSVVKNYDITLPIIIDYEYDTDGTGRLATAGLAPATKTAIVNAFGDTVKAAGYTPMVYANKNMLSKDMDAGAINYLVWLAQYANEATYTGDYTCWQYSSKGSVSGINGNVDMNYWYGDYSGILHAYTGYYNGIYYGDVFDPNEYVVLNPDLKTAIGEKNLYALLQHFVQNGMKEARMGSYEFDPVLYKSNYPDLQSAFGDDWTKYYIHYINFGKAENRNATTYKVKEMMYRMFNPTTGEHFYTNSREERLVLVQSGWNYEGVAWHTPASSNTPVYRLFNPKSGAHHYTPSAEEKDELVKKQGWNYEGIGWYSDDNQTVPMYRLYDPTGTGMAEVRAHHYTASTEERDQLLAAGWRDEGIGWYGK